MCVFRISKTNGYSLLRSGESCFYNISPTAPHSEMLFSPTRVVLLFLVFSNSFLPTPPPPISELQVGHGFPDMLVDNTDRRWSLPPPLHDLRHTVRTFLGAGGGRGDIRHTTCRTRRRGRYLVVPHRPYLLRVGRLRVRGTRQIDTRGVLRVRYADGGVDRDVDIFEAATTTTTTDDDNMRRRRRRRRRRTRGIRRRRVVAWRRGVGAAVVVPSCRWAAR